MKSLTVLCFVAIILASLWITHSSADVDKLELPTVTLPLPEDPQEAPVEPAQEPSSESGPAVVWQQQWVTEYVRQCGHTSCRLVPRRVLKWVAVQAAKPFRTARVLYHDGVTRTLELLRPVGAVATCTRSITQAVAGEQWVGTDEQIYVRQDDGTWRPKRDDARIPQQATLSPPVASVPTPIVTQRASYTTYQVTTTPYRARMPVFTRRCGPVRRLLGWCR